MVCSKDPMRFIRRVLVLGLLVTGCGDGDAPSADAGAPDAAAFPAADRPGKRSDTAGVADPTTGTIALFGGDNGPIVNQIPSPAYLADTWVLDPEDGWTEVAATGPSARGRHAVAIDPTGGRMFAFGGRFRPAGQSGAYTLFNELWAFDYANRTWTLVDDGTNAAPAPRYFATAAYDDASDTLYVFGGGTNTDPLALQTAVDVWAHDGDGWTEITPAGSAPPPRLFMAYTYDPARNQLIVFGGQIGDFVTPSRNDLYALDLASGVWTQLHDGAGTAPSGRFSAMMTYDAAGDRYLLVGGHADAGVTNDVWAFSPASGAWGEVAGGDAFTGAALGCLGNPREIPAGYVDQDLAAPERRSGGVFAVLDGDAWLFGGESDCSDHLDDTWRLDLTSGTWTELIDARSGESCARRNDACECLCL